MERIREFRLTDQFVLAAHQLPQEKARRVWKALDNLARDQNYPSLKRERLRGKAEGVWSIRVDDDYRIIFCDENPPLLLYVGPHNEAYRFAERFERSAEVARPFAEAVGQSKAGEVLPKVPFTPIKRESTPVMVKVQVAPDQVKNLLTRTLKYLPLTAYLMSQSDDQLELSFDQIERIIGTHLPESARKHPEWWGNNTDHHVQATAWLAIGWKKERLRLKEQKVGFARTS